MSISQGRSGTLIGARRSRSASRCCGPRPACSTLLGAKAAARPAAAARRRRAGQGARRHPQPRLLDSACSAAIPAIVGKTHHAQRRRARRGDAKNQFTVVGVLGPDFLLNDEIMPTVASIRQMDLFLPLPLGADAVNAARRRELQPDGAAEAGRDDGAGAGRRRARSPAGSATRTSAIAPSRSRRAAASIRSSATCGARCSCCWAR